MNEEMSFPNHPSLDSLVEFFLAGPDKVISALILL
jgi:hypothetical protein